MAYKATVVTNAARATRPHQEKPKLLTTIDYR